MAKEILNNPLKKNIFGLLLLLLGFGGIQFIEKYTNKPILKLSPQDTTIHFNEHLVKALSFGQYRFSSSVLWAETLLRAGTEHYKENDLNNWIYRRLSLITTLDPYFYQAYLYGGMYLSVVKDDDIGAKKIYEKGLKIYPDDLYLCLNAGFHFYYELADYKKAASIYERIVDHPGAPSFIPNLLARIQSEDGNLKDAFNTLLSVSKTVPQDSILQNRFKTQLYSLKAEIDLKCLNSKEEGCHKVDFFGQPYIFENKKWVAKENWEPYRIKKRASPKKEAPQNSN